MPEELPHLISEYLFFIKRQRRLVRTVRTEKLAREHPSIPRFEWEDQGKQFVAYLDTTVKGKYVTFNFHFGRNGIPITFQPILNSYKRFLVREENQNICSLC